MERKEGWEFHQGVQVLQRLQFQVAIKGIFIYSLSQRYELWVQLVFVRWSEHQREHELDIWTVL